MKKLVLDTGIQEFKIQGGGVLRFHPGDPNLYARFLEAEEKLSAMEQELTRQARALLDLQDGKILLYFPGKSTQLVYDPENECYRPLRSDMKVWDGKDWADPDHSDVLYL